jgi:hypothetical protein
MTLLTLTPHLQMQMLLTLLQMPLLLTLQKLMTIHADTDNALIFAQQFVQSFGADGPRSS